VRSLAPIAALILMILMAACTTTPDATPGEYGEAGDTLRGMVRITGAQPGTTIVLETAQGTTIVLSESRELLQQMAAMEIVAWGQPQPDSRFRVTRALVRSVSGIPAVDGILERAADGRHSLLTAAGERLPLPWLPVALHAQAGSRIWLAGPLDRPPELYGVIR
jgi:hypothetical protein